MRTAISIGVVTLHTANISRFADIGLKNKTYYCREHGYTFIDETYIDVSRPPAWSKILALKTHLQHFDWLFWTDADSVITNPTRRLEEFVNSYSDIVIGRDINGLNSGQMFLRNSSWTAKFLTDVWAQEDLVDNPWWEQAAIIRLYDREPARFTVVPQRAFNSFESCWEPGDFIIHFPATSAAVREDRMRIYDSLCRESGPRADLRLAGRKDFGPLLNKLRLTDLAVEVGVAEGDFSELFLSSWTGRHLHLVDLWMHQSDYHDISNVSDDEHENKCARTVQRFASMQDRVRIHRCSSNDAAKRFTDRSLDFVYLDANHSFDAVCNDIRSWYPKVRQGGVLAGHDFLDGTLPEGNFGVASAVRAFAKWSGEVAFTTYEREWPSWYVIKQF